MQVEDYFLLSCFDFSSSFCLCRVIISLWFLSVRALGLLVIGYSGLGRAGQGRIRTRGQIDNILGSGVSAIYEVN